MSNEIAKIGSPEAIPGDLGKQVRRIVILGAEASIDFSEDAAEWLARRKALAAPGSREQCHAWMAVLVQGVNGVTESGALGREAAIWAMCHDLPAFVWCQKTVNELWARTAFLPSPGEAREVLAAYSAPLLKEITALEKIATATPPPRLEQAPPYVMPRAPEWAFDRTVRGQSGAVFEAQPPQRSIEEQIAALKG